ncbi:MAG: hypothetical protein IPG07_10315 [Crocinitomicaceae bacterium]|nr:hypothetical protein [Crocinitomicaceae bacterium]
MKFLIPFSVILFCSCNASQNTDVVSQTDTMTFDSVQTDLPVQDSVIDYGASVIPIYWKSYRNILLMQT